MKNTKARAQRALLMWESSKPSKEEYGFKNNVWPEGCAGSYYAALTTWQNKVLRSIAGDPQEAYIKNLLKTN